MQEGCFMRLNGIFDENTEKVLVLKAIKFHSMAEMYRSLGQMYRSLV
jgi:hypothetical protein